jgi:hypothetical protein
MWLTAHSSWSASRSTAGEWDQIFAGFSSGIAADCMKTALVVARFWSFALLHMTGGNDPLMDVADSSQLMECFQLHGRWVGIWLVSIQNRQQSAVLR